MARAPKPRQVRRGRPGRVIGTLGRRVRVRDEEGDRVCFLSGQRAVVGDRVQWVEARGEGGKLVAVEERDTVLARVDFKGQEQVLAANLGGLLVVAAGTEPPFRAGLVDRYVVAAGAAGLDVAVCINKIDLGIPDEVEAELALREAAGLKVLRASSHTGEGIDGVRAFVSEWAADAPWAVVGHSGVGKTSLVAALLPGEDVGAVGELSEHWGTGQHTTTGSTIFAVGEGELIDSPGIRTFAPGGLEAVDVRRHFPGFAEVYCRYRDCLHRPDEDGCEAPDTVDAELLRSYRRLLDELVQIEDRRAP